MRVVPFFLPGFLWFSGLATTQEGFRFGIPFYPIASDYQSVEQDATPRTGIIAEGEGPKISFSLGFTAGL